MSTNRRIERTGQDFDGHTYVPERDHARLASQLDRVFSVMSDGRWRILSVLSRLTGDPEASISSRLRDLRKPKFGAHEVESVPGDAPGLWRYRVTVNENAQLAMAMAEKAAKRETLYIVKTDGWVGQAFVNKQQALQAYAELAEKYPDARFLCMREVKCARKPAAKNPRHGTTPRHPGRRAE